MPRILNLKDTNYKVPPNAIYVGRAMPRYNLPTSRWANPFRIGKDGTREEVIAKYKEWFMDRLMLFDCPCSLNELKHELKGHDLICWCSPLSCHAEVLLELANKENE